MDNIEIKLDKYNDAQSTDRQKEITLELQRDEGTLQQDEYGSVFDEYEQYIKEYDESGKYRLIFTINPLCTNVLFNPITEIVYGEGSDDCVFFGKDGAVGDLNGISGLNEYLEYTDRTADDLNHYDMIMDTAYSHKAIGGVEYHCGYDIFNNHYFRRNDFISIGKANKELLGGNNSFFNTISDTVRDINGNIVRQNILKQHSENGNIIKQMDLVSTSMHIYGYDTIKSFRQSIHDNLREENAWFGFKNPSNIGLKNYNDIAINKGMNDRDANEFVDMYPDRTLFSFQPKYNPYRKRQEHNWWYCLTYPYRNEFSNPLVSAMDDGKIVANGLQCYIYAYDTYMDKDNVEHIYENGYLTLRSFVKNGLKEGDYVYFTVFYEDGETYDFERIKTAVPIESIGEGNVFKVRTSYLHDFFNESGSSRVITDIRFARKDGDSRCKYYFRKFRRIPNFINSDVYVDGKVTEEEIEKYVKKPFNSTLDKLAFSKNIYDDNISQIIFNDTIDINGIKDNYGREITEIYLTVVKKNRGWKEWYGVDDEMVASNTPRYSGEDIEYSHCFGKVTEGLDMIDEIYDYNIHYIHNVNVSKMLNDEKMDKNNPQGIIGDILSLGGEVNEDNEEFYGDLVEFSEASFKERVLEDVYQRFNTVQREMVGENGADTEYSKIYYTDINKDDFETLKEREDEDITEVKNFVDNLPKDDVREKDTFYINIFPEGYYYKPHYKIILKEYDVNINKGYHTKVYYTAEEESGKTIVFNTQKSPVEMEREIAEGKPNPRKNKEYYFEMDDIVYLYYENTEERVNGKVLKIEGKYNDRITVEFEREVSLSDTVMPILFKTNESKPEGSYEVNNSSGKYIWRNTKKKMDIEKESELYDMPFTNGTHYIHKNINFYLKRQNPNGVYGMAPNKYYCISSLVVKGKEKDIDNIEYNSTITEDRTC